MAYPAFSNIAASWLRCRVTSQDVKGAGGTLRFRCANYAISIIEGFEIKQDHTAKKFKKL